MAFTKLDKPPPPANETPVVTAAVTVNRRGGAVLALRLNRFVRGQFGGDRCDVSVGEGDDEGRLLIEAAPKGTFLFGKAGGRGGDAAGSRLTLPCGARVPRSARPGRPCKIEELSAGRMLLSLPLEAWIAAPAAAPKAAPAADRPGPRVEELGAAGAYPPKSAGLDVVSYLKNKGRPIERSGARILLSGEEIPLSQALRMVNSHRQDAGLDALGLAAVW